MANLAAYTSLLSSAASLRSSRMTSYRRSVYVASQGLPPATQDSCHSHRVIHIMKEYACPVRCLR